MRETVAGEGTGVEWCDPDSWYLRPGLRQPAIGTDCSSHRDVAVTCRIKNNA
jgi:hypothetical protein